MAIDPRIPLAGGTVIDPSRGINQLIQATQFASQQERQGRLDQRQLDQDAEAKRLRDLQLQKITQQITSQGRNESVNQMTSAFIRIDEQIKAGDLEGARQTALSHKSSITELQKTNPNINTNTTDQFLNLLPTDPTGAARLISTERGILESIRDFSKSKTLSGARAFAPVTLINKETKEKILAAPVVDPNTGIATLSELDIPEGFEVSTETSEEKRIADILAANTRKIQALEAEQEFKPKTAAEIERAKLEVRGELRPRIEAAITEARAAAKERGEAFTDLSRTEAALPGLLEAVAELKELAVIATSTIGGKIFDQAVQQSGFGATKGATARAKFIAIINNQVLPLLKPTFGGSFSVQEGESLKATMGDPDAPPEAKIVQLEAFIEQKVRTIQSKQRQLSQEPTVTTQQEPSVQIIKFDAQGNQI